MRYSGVSRTPSHTETSQGVLQVGDHVESNQTPIKMSSGAGRRLSPWSTPAPGTSTAHLPSLPLATASHGRMVPLSPAHQTRRMGWDGTSCSQPDTALLHHGPHQAFLDPPAPEPPLSAADGRRCNEPEPRGGSTSRSLTAHPLYNAWPQPLLQRAPSPSPPRTNPERRCSHPQSGSGSGLGHGAVPSLMPRASRTGIGPEVPASLPPSRGDPSHLQAGREGTHEKGQGRKRGGRAAALCSRRARSDTSGFIEDLILLSAH